MTLFKMTLQNDTLNNDTQHNGTLHNENQHNGTLHNYTEYEESVVVRIKSNLLLMIFWFHIINYNS